MLASVADQVADDKLWMFEAEERSRLPVAIARAVVRPKLGQIHVWLVNAGNTTVTLYLKTTLGILEELADSEPTTSDQTVVIAESERIGPEVVENSNKLWSKWNTLDQETESRVFRTVDDLSFCF